MLLIPTACSNRRNFVPADWRWLSVTIFRTAVVRYQGSVLRPATDIKCDFKRRRYRPQKAHGNTRLNFTRGIKGQTLNADKRATFRKNIDFLEIMFRMSCSSTRLAFGACLEQLPFSDESDYTDDEVEAGRERLRTAIESQIDEFERLLNLVGESRASSIGG